MNLTLILNCLTLLMLANAAWRMNKLNKSLKEGRQEKSDDAGCDRSTNRLQMAKALGYQSVEDCVRNATRDDVITVLEVADPDMYDPDFLKALLRTVGEREKRAKLLAYLKQQRDLETA